VAKVRVYELAKKFGVPSKTVLSTLSDMGEFVRSASSTVEAPVVRKLEAKFADDMTADGAKANGAKTDGAKKKPAAKKAPAKKAAAKKPAKKGKKK